MAMKTLRLVVAATAAALALGLTACGPDANKATPAAGSDDDQYLKYTQCLQKQGIEASYSKDAQGRYHFEADAGPKDPEFVAARKACAALLPDRMRESASPAELDQMVRIADCMRKQGLQVENPTVDDPSIKMGGSVDDSQKAEAIKAACEKEVKGASPSR
jgi:hypothetical protein